MSINFAAHERLNRYCGLAIVLKTLKFSLKVHWLGFRWFWGRGRRCRAVFAERELGEVWGSVFGFDE